MQLPFTARTTLHTTCTGGITPNHSQRSAGSPSPPKLAVPPLPPFPAHTAPRTAPAGLVQRPLEEPGASRGGADRRSRGARPTVARLLHGPPWRYTRRGAAGHLGPAQPEALPASVGASAFAPEAPSHEQLRNGCHGGHSGTNHTAHTACAYICPLDLVAAGLEASYVVGVYFRLHIAKLPHPACGMGGSAARCGNVAVARRVSVSTYWRRAPTHTCNLHV